MPTQSKSSPDNIYCCPPNKNLYKIQPFYARHKRPAQSEPKLLQHDRPFSPVQGLQMAIHPRPLPLLLLTQLRTELLHRDVPDRLLPAPAGCELRDAQRPRGG